jgi:hypothetical protein
MAVMRQLAIIPPIEATAVKRDGVMAHALELDDIANDAA